MSVYKHDHDVNKIYFICPNTKPLVSLLGTDFIYLQSNKEPIRIQYLIYKRRRENTTLHPFLVHYLLN